jgi:NAD(P)-dependent dehydrogenase (short-subunit alcohol dehydrogenase family)
MSFGAKTTTDELLEGRDLTGMTVAITGGTGGIGEETVRSFAAAGATVAMIGRDRGKADAALAKIRDRHRNAAVSFTEIDLQALASVQAGSQLLAAQFPRLDLLINNAGIMAGPLRRTADGHEAQFGVNHLAHFALTQALLPSLLASPASRVINLSSHGHRMGQPDLDDPDFLNRPYTGFGGYGQAKSANILFSVELDRRYRTEGLRSAAVHPGGIRTELGRSFTETDRDEMTAMLKGGGGSSGPAFEWKNVEQGAATTVWAALVADGEEIGGRYCEDCSVGTPMPYAVDPATAERLWSLSEQMTASTSRPC